MNDGRDDYEVFAQFGGAGKPITYLGSVRGSDPILAWQAARDVYTRREDCTVLWVVPRTAVVSGDAADRLTLSQGSSRRYRGPNYPSAKRRARLKTVAAAEEKAK